MVTQLASRVQMQAFLARISTAVQHTLWPFQKRSIGVGKVE